MSSTHLHLLLNHLPILGTLFGVLLLASGYIFKSRPIRHAALVTLVLTAIFTIPTFASGEPAEESIEHMPGLNHPMIEEHEDSAKGAAIAAYVMGVLAAASLFGSIKEKPFAKVTTAITLVAGIAVFGLMARTGNIGGKIRHTEITPGAINNAQNGQGEQGQGMEHEEEEDD